MLLDEFLDFMYDEGYYLICCNGIDCEECEHLQECLDCFKGFGSGDEKLNIGG